MSLPYVMTLYELTREVKQLKRRPFGGSTTFSALTDGPGAYTGHAGESVRVNGTEDALEYFAAVGQLTGNSIFDNNIFLYEFTT